MSIRFRLEETGKQCLEVLKMLAGDQPLALVLSPNMQDQVMADCYIKNELHVKTQPIGEISPGIEVHTFGFGKNALPNTIVLQLLDTQRQYAQSLINGNALFKATFVFDTALAGANSGQWVS